MRTSAVKSMRLRSSGICQYDEFLPTLSMTFFAKNGLLNKPKPHYFLLLLTLGKDN